NGDSSGVRGAAWLWPSTRHSRIDRSYGEHVVGIQPREDCNLGARRYRHARAGSPPTPSEAGGGGGVGGGGRALILAQGLVNSSHHSLRLLQPAPCRSCSWRSPSRSHRGWSKTLRTRAATSLASRFSSPASGRSS